MLRLTADGTPEAGGYREVRLGLERTGTTDVIVLCHDHNPVTVGGVTGLSFGQALLEPLGELLSEHGRAGRRVALLEVQWPGRRWADEPVPGVDETGPLPDPWFGQVSAVETGPPAPPDEATCRAVRAAFPPVQRVLVDELLDLLTARPHEVAALRRARALVRTLAESAPDRGDGERREITSLMEIDDPQPDQLFADFTLAMADLGILTEPASVRAGFGSSVESLWHGAQEVLRQLTYSQLKQRATEVGIRGLGPILTRLAEDRPGLGINLVGHGIGARVAAYALRALPARRSGLSGVAERFEAITPFHEWMFDETSAAGAFEDLPSAAPIRSVTLFQAVVSHFAFAGSLPFDPSRSGALAGLLDQVDGPVTACYSRYDTSLGVFYPLAARGAGPEGPGAPELESPPYRWGVLGRNGHQPPARELPLHRTGTPYMLGSGLVTVDASRVIRRGGPPGGAHSDVCHPELGWLVLNAAGLV